jgi:hypothetical protein
MASNKVMDASVMDSRPKTLSSAWGNGGRKQRVQRRSVNPGLRPSCNQEEVLVVDDRAHLRPAQVVESKLTRLLQEAVVPVSHLQMRGLLKAR